jgi:hypothetical protein
MVFSRRNYSVSIELEFVAEVDLSAISVRGIL